MTQRAKAAGRVVVGGALILGVLIVVVAWGAVLTSRSAFSGPDRLAPETLAGWGLPRDLLLHADALEVLELPPDVDRLDWLPRGLVALGARRVAGDGLSGLPSSVRELDLRYGDISGLSRLDVPLHTLDLRWSRLDDLDGLAPPLRRSLRVLRYGGAGARPVTRWPPNLLGLEVTDLPFEDGRGLPVALQWLHLRGPDVVALRNLPPELTTLRIEEARIRDFSGVPDSVTELVLHRSRIAVDHLPPFLTRLEWSVPRVRIVGALPPSIRSLRIVGTTGPVSGRRIPSLPPWLERLAVVPPAGDLFDSVTLPESVMALEIDGYPGGELGTELPAGLTELSLADADLVSLPPLPAGLRVLDLSGTALQEELHALVDGGSTDGPGAPPLERLILRGYPRSELGPIPATVRCLDLSESPALASLGSLPPHLEHLDLGHTGVSALPALPGSLRSLTITGSRLRELGPLPDGLEELVVGAGQLESLEGAPPSLRILRFEEAPPMRGEAP